MVCLDTPTSRATSSAFRPASICFSAPMICASLCRLLHMLLPLSQLRNHIQFRADLGEQVIPSLWSLERLVTTLAGLGRDPDWIRIVINRWDRKDDATLNTVEKRSEERRVGKSVDLGGRR